MDYRNIDTDYILYKTVGRYWSGELNLDQLYWKLESEGYSKKEIDCAVYDYYLIYTRTNQIQNVCVLIGIFGLVIYLIYFLTNLQTIVKL
jgi:hypothetical protein